MRERKRLMLIVTAIVFVTLNLALSTPPSHASTSTQLRTFTVIVSRNGFNGTAGSFTLNVQQGDSVKITFVYGDDDLAVDNPHAIAFEGYRIQTASIGKSNPTVTIEFVADVSGTFNFYCYIPCLGMENLLGHLVVAPTEGSQTPTTLNLVVTSTNSNSFLVSAKVEDISGRPLAGVPVTFYENTTFGKLFLKKVSTDPEGTAVLNYTATRIGAVQILAENLGSAQYGSSAKSVVVTTTVRPTHPQIEGNIYLGVKVPNQRTGIFYGISYPPNLSMIAVPRTMNIIIVAIAGIVLLSVWSTYGYIWRQLAGLPKQSLPLPRTWTPFPETEVPVVPSTIVGEQAVITDKMMSLLLLAPLVGVGDVLLVNNMGLALLWRAIVLVGLALSETAALVAVITGKRSRD